MSPTTAPENEPGRKWDHSYALQEGDVLLDETGHWADIRITDIKHNGAINWVAVSSGDDVDEGAHGEWSEAEIRTALVDGMVERKRDGKSHELAVF